MRAIRRRGFAYAAIPEKLFAYGPVHHIHKKFSTKLSGSRRFTKFSLHYTPQLLRFDSAGLDGLYCTSFCSYIQFCTSWLNPSRFFHSLMHGTVKWMPASHQIPMNAINSWFGICMGGNPFLITPPFLAM